MKTPAHGGERVAAALQAHGVPVLFTLVQQKETRRPKDVDVAWRKDFVEIKKQ